MCDVTRFYHSTAYLNVQAGHRVLLHAERSPLARLSLRGDGIARDAREAFREPPAITSAQYPRQ